MLFWLQKRAGGAGDDDISPSRPLRPVPTKAGCGICHLAALGMGGREGTLPECLCTSSCPPPHLPAPGASVPAPQGKGGGTGDILPEGTSSHRGQRHILPEGTGDILLEGTAIAHPTFVNKRVQKALILQHPHPPGSDLSPCSNHPVPGYQKEGSRISFI